MDKRMQEAVGQNADIVDYDVWIKGKDGIMVAARQLSEAINGKQVIFCRLDHGRRTLLSAHLYRCLYTVCCGRDLAPAEDVLRAWLSNNEGSTAAEMQQGSGLPKAAFDKAFLALQQQVEIMPVRLLSVHPQTLEPEALWVTSGFWQAVAPRPSNYQDIAYCLAEIYRLMPSAFTKEEIGRALYSCA